MVHDVQSAPVGAGDSSGAASPDITASEKMSNLIPPPADVPAPADASSGINTRSSNISSSVLLGVVIGIIGAFVLAAVALLMVRHRRQKRRKQQLLQLFKAQGDEPMPHLATAALVRAASSASSESSGSQNTQAGGMQCMCHSSKYVQLLLLPHNPVSCPGGAQQHQIRA